MGAVERTGLEGMAGLLEGLGLASCWERRERRGLWTTRSARTPLQPQPHKAVRRDAAGTGVGEEEEGRHAWLKDWVVFWGAQLAAVGASRKNTGQWVRRREARLAVTRAESQDRPQAKCSAGCYRLTWFEAGVKGAAAAHSKIPCRAII